MENRALEIAEKHLQKANPSGWDGCGEQPGDFSPLIVTYAVDDETELDISFEKGTDGKWLHLCELRDKETEELLAIQSDGSISSKEIIAATIREVCSMCDITL